MFKNTLKITFRVITRNKTYSIPNICGLAVGMGAFILIALYIQYEYNWDKFNMNYKCIYRVEQHIKYADGIQMSNQTQFPLAKHLVFEYPEITNSVTLRNVWGEFLSSTKELTFFENDGYYANNSLFDIFTFTFIKGIPDHALSEPFTIVLTEELAKKYFPHENPIGKIIRAQSKFNCKVTGVIENPPLNSHFRASYFISFSSFQSIYQWDISSDWGDNGAYTYVLLQDNKLAESVHTKISNFLNAHLINNNRTLYLKPMKELHLKSHVDSDLTIIIILFSAIGIFTLIIACINFMNLATAGSQSRLKEIGIKKVVGANRFLLIKQFIGESMIYCFISLLIAFLLVELTLPIFNTIVNRALKIQFVVNWTFTIGMLGIALLVGIIASIYPALVISAYKPDTIIKGSSITINKRGMFRKILVVFQFLISVILIISTIILFNQLKYMKNKNLGFTKDCILIAESKDSQLKGSKNYNLLKSQLMHHPDIQSATISLNAPFRGSWDRTINWEGSSKQKINLIYNKVDEDFIRTYGIKIEQGRNFSREIASDKKACLINETAARKFGWENPIGKRLWNNQYTVIGVMKDFHQQTVYLPIQPYFMIFHSGDVNGYCLFSIKISRYNVIQAKSFVKENFETFFGGELFEFTFLDQDFDKETFDTIEGVNRTFGFFSTIAILIASFGMFGLVSFSIQQKTKEIGVRKVLGANVCQISFLLGCHFLILILIANIIAWPLVYLVMSNLLQQFAYRIEIQIGAFLIAGLISLLSVFMSIGYQVLRAAYVNPVESLRYE